MRRLIGPGARARVIAWAAARGSRSGWERNEEGVSLRVYFDAALGGARLADDPAMLGERVRVCLCAELAQERSSIPQRP